MSDRELCICPSCLVKFDLVFEKVNQLVQTGGGLLDLEDMRIIQGALAIFLGPRSAVKSELEKFMMAQELRMNRTECNIECGCNDCPGRFTDPATTPRTEDCYLLRCDCVHCPNHTK